MALAGIRFSCGDDADFFFTFFLYSVSNKQNHQSIAGEANRVSPVFPINGSLDVRDGVGVGEDTGRRFK
jgi:hypothetical protein